MAITDPSEPCPCEEFAPYIDTETGNWFVCGEDTGVKAQGEDGADGKDGVDGEDCECDLDNIKVPVCHNGNTIEVSINALGAHLAHGDTIGVCPVVPEEESLVTEKPVVKKKK